MALFDTTWYLNYGDGATTGYYAVAVRPQNTAVAAGVLRRQFTAPAVGGERVFVCIVAGTTANTTDATWTLTRGLKTTDGTATWQECTGQASLNGDLTNTATWAQVKAATPAVLGQIIKRSNGASYQICTTAGAMSASEPSFSDTAGVTTTDTTAVWTSLGPVGNFTGGQAPHARLATVFGTNWFASGNTIYVGHNHAETQAASIAMSGSSALMAKILCHNSAGPYPPTALTTGATVTTTGGATIGLSMQGSFYFYGLIFSAATTGASSVYLTVAPSAVGQVQNWYYFDNCSLRIASPGGSAYMSLGGGAWNVIVFDNTTVRFVAVGQYVTLQNIQFIWRNTGQILASGSSVPSALLKSNAGGSNNAVAVLEGLDLSQLTGSLFDNSPAPSIASLAVKDCKLNAATTVTAPINAGMTVQMVRSASDATAYKSTRYAYEGTETTETSIVRTGGAEDPAGQAQSRKIVTTANAQWLRPFQAEPYAIYNETTGSAVTVTVYGASSSLPNNDDIWLELEYLGSSASPLGAIVTTTKSGVLAANAAVASDASVWVSGPAAPFKLATTITPQMPGYIHARVRAAKASATFYIDPKPVLT